jgi:hypothetical protein
MNKYNIVKLCILSGILMSLSAGLMYSYCKNKWTKPYHINNETIHICHSMPPGDMWLREILSSNSSEKQTVSFLKNVLNYAYYTSIIFAEDVKASEKFGNKETKISIKLKRNDKDIVYYNQESGYRYVILYDDMKNMITYIDCNSDGIFDCFFYSDNTGYIIIHDTLIKTQILSKDPIKFFPVLELKEGKTYIFKENQWRIKETGLIQGQTGMALN